MKRFLALSLCLALLLPARLAFGILGVGDVAIVSDPAGLIQQTATALRTWMSNANEVIMMDNQVKQLYNDALNLAKLPMDVIAEVQNTVGTYQQILAQAQGAYRSVTGTMDQFEAIYNNPKLSLIDKAVAGVNQLKLASFQASASQAIYDQLCAQLDRMGRLGAASQAAVGELQAQQATNQMLLVLAEQQSTMQQMTATMGRMQVAYYMRQATGEEAARLNAQQYLQMEQPQDWASRPNQGIALPD